MIFLLDMIIENEGQRIKLTYYNFWKHVNIWNTSKIHGCIICWVCIIGASLQFYISN